MINQRRLPLIMHDQKICHLAGKIAPDGRVSALCFKKPRAIDLSLATWTLLRNAVTCPKCRALPNFERLEGKS